MIGVEHRCYGDGDGANQHHSVDGLQRTPVGLDPADPDAEQQRYSGTRYFYQNIVPAMRVRVRVRVFVYVCGSVVGMIRHPSASIGRRGGGGGGGGEGGGDATSALIMTHFDKPNHC